MKYISKKVAKQEVEILISDWLHERWLNKQELDSCLAFIDWLRSNSPGHLKFNTGSSLSPEGVIEYWFEDELKKFRRIYNGKNPA